MVEWFRADGSDILINVRLTPKGGADAIAGIVRLAGGSAVLACRVRAVAEKGEANAALEKLIARGLGVAAAQVAIVAGHKARIKTLRIAGGGELRDRLATLAGSQENGKVRT